MSEPHIEKVLLLTVRHLDADGREYVQHLCDLGSNHAEMPSGGILLVPEDEGGDGVPMIRGKAPGCLLAVHAAARLRVGDAE